MYRLIVFYIMKNLKLLLAIFLILIGGFLIGYGIYTSIKILQICITENDLPITQKVELPEEYKAIDSTDCLRGHFDSDGTLHIEFNNQKKQII